MRPHAGAVVLFLGQLSLAQAAARRRHGMLDRALGVRATEDLEKRQNQAPATVTVLQTVTVGAADAGVVANNTVTVTVTANSGAAPVTVTVCPPGSPGQALGAADGPPGAGAAVSPPGAAVPGVPDVPTGGIGVQIIAIPTALRTLSKVVAAPPTTSAAPAGPPSVQNPAAPLAPLPGSVALASSLAPLPSASGPASALQPLPNVPSSSLASLPALASSAPGGGPTLQPLPGSASLQPLPSSSSAPAAIVTRPAVAGPAPPPPAAALDSTLNLGAPIPGGAAVATPAVGPGGSFGGLVGAVPIPGGTDAPPAVAQPAVDPTVTVAPDVAAGAQVNIDVSGLTLNSQLDLGNLVQASPAPVVPVRM
ncbi:hypothetical protein B0T18DRAFT_151117 [Schizothecium vesticola]|uniref:Uncharacterized protein n=1 Tax=Schizothecium vesticola TaxID=314040 RepID=A0AA40EVP3_9PEZI|nr:hypothetical protein B0T18DRAFT_151117 [Schizothecium vesticola]